MRLSTKARYALRVMIALVRMSENQQPVSLAKVAERAQISYRYLEKLVTALKKASLVLPVSGRTGGYHLAQPAKDIRIGQIIEAGIGPINIVKCVKRPETCMLAEFCECRLLYMRINEQILQTLNEYSLADMTGEGWREKISRQLAPNEDGGGDPQSDRLCAQ